VSDQTFNVLLESRIRQIVREEIAASYAVTERPPMLFIPPKTLIDPTNPSEDHSVESELSMQVDFLAKLLAKLCLTHNVTPRAVSDRAEDYLDNLRATR
jgi:hypothetical protein